MIATLHKKLDRRLLRLHTKILGDRPHQLLKSEAREILCWLHQLPRHDQQQLFDITSDTTRLSLGDKDAEAPVHRVFRALTRVAKATNKHLDDLSLGELQLALNNYFASHCQPAGDADQEHIRETVLSNDGIDSSTSYLNTSVDVSLLRVSRLSRDVFFSAAMEWKLFYRLYLAGEAGEARDALYETLGHGKWKGKTNLDKLKAAVEDTLRPLRLRIETRKGSWKLGAV